MKPTKYRQKVNAIVLNNNNQILLVQLHVYKKNQWNTPGGGIEKNEDPRDTLKRELKEELNIEKYEILLKSKIENKYDYSPRLMSEWAKRGTLKYKGQIQAQFVVKFEGKDSDIKIQADEIRAWRWTCPDELDSLIIANNQTENIKNVLEEYETKK